MANPTWECQIRTSDEEVAKLWATYKLPVKPVVVSKSEIYWRVNLRKKSLDKDGNKKEPVKVVDGKLRPIDAKTIGNGSVGNVRVWPYEFKDKVTGQAKRAFVLMSVQITKLKVYIPSDHNDFEEEDYEIISDEEGGLVGGHTSDNDDY